MGVPVQDLIDALIDEPESMYVRLVASWLLDGEVSDVAPVLTCRPVIDALAAAATAQLARQLGVVPPAWTNDSDRVLERLWHPGVPALFGFSLAHTPAEFAARGIVMDADNLVCV